MRPSPSRKLNTHGDFCVLCKHWPRSRCLQRTRQPCSSSRQGAYSRAACRKVTGNGRAIPATGSAFARASTGNVWHFIGAQRISRLKSSGILHLFRGRLCHFLTLTFCRPCSLVVRTPPAAPPMAAQPRFNDLDDLCRHVVTLVALILNE